MSIKQKTQQLLDPSVDWTLLDIDIARKYKLAPAVVGYMRLALEKPKSIPVKEKFRNPNIDWSKSNGLIAAELGATAMTIARARQNLGKQRVADIKDRFLSPNIDWKLTDKAIAEQLGVNSATVWRARCILGIEPVKPAKLSNRRWLEVDWSVPDALIAIDMGVSKQRVHQVRNSLNKPRSKSIAGYADDKLRLNSTAERDEKILALAKHHRKTAAQIAEELQIHNSAVYTVAKKHGISFPTRKKSFSVPDWAHSVNWGYPNNLIAEKLGIATITVARMRIRMKQQPTSKSSRRQEKTINIDWENVDWSKSIEKLSHELGVSRATIQNYMPVLAHDEYAELPNRVLSI